MQISYAQYSTISLFVEQSADLRKIPLEDIQTNMLAFAGGQTELNDGKGGIFVFDNESTLADDGKDTIQTEGLATGRWVRIISNSSVADAQAVLDAAELAADNSAQSAANALNHEAGAALAQGNAERAAALAQAARIIAGAYANDYSTTLPKGITAITLDSGGTGYTDGTFPLILAGGPVAASATFTVEGGIVTAITVTNAGLSTSPTAPTLDFSNGGAGTGATATVTVGSIIPDQSSYWVASDDSDYLLLWKRDGDVPARVNNPDGSQVALPTRNLLVSAIADSSIFQNGGTLADYPALKRLKEGTWISGLDPTHVYYVRILYRDQAAGDRFNLIITDANLGQDVLGVGPSGSTITPTGYTGFKTIPVVELNGSGLSGQFVVDFGTGELFEANNLGADATALKLPSVSFVPAQNAEIVATAREVVTTRASIAPQLALTEDEYLKAMVRDIVVAGLDPDDRVWLNYETIFYSAIPLYRTKFTLHSEFYGNRPVATWSFQSSTLPTDLPERIHLTMMADGGPNSITSAGLASAEVGASAILEIDWSQVSWDKATTEHATAGATEVRNCIVTTQDVEANWLAPTIKHRQRVTIGAAGDYPTVVSALVAHQLDTFTISRSSYPSSDFMSAEYPMLFEVIDDNHVEEVLPVDINGLPQSTIMLPHGSILRMKPDTLLFMAAAGSTTHPVIEMAFTAAIIGGTIEQRNTGGYVIHVDGVNSLSKRATIVDYTQRRRIQTVFRNVKVKTATGNTAPRFGCGISDNQTMLFDACWFDRTDAKEVFLSHGSPNSVEPGRVIMRNCIGPAVTRFATLLKSSAGDHRHVFIADGCEGAQTVASGNAIETGNTFGDGLPGWIRAGNLSGMTYAADLNP